MYLAHFDQETKRPQTIPEHLSGTAERAEKFAQSFHDGEYGRICGLLHDTGKYSAAFQKRIRGGFNRVDHSTAGAQEIYKNLKGFGILLAYCIAGHHGGLPDGGTPVDTESDATLSGRLKRSVEDYSAYFDENTLPNLPDKPPCLRPLGKIGFSVSFYIRMLYSCLVDADYLDTEAFYKGGQTARPKDYSLSDFLPLLQKKLEEFDPNKTDIARRRHQILENCLAAAKKPKGLYSLTVPTGGGKTLSSLAFALNHAKEHQMDRVIYVIPYVSIIEQNAAVFKEIFGDKWVLEHHSNFNFEDAEDEISAMQKLASENWDMPLVVTTNVQFFESLFASKPSRCRKNHNIANSVVIFDEAQMLPTQYLTPCVRAISELVCSYQCTAVLCSATQPALRDLLPPNLKAEEICQNTKELYSSFRRVQIVPRGFMDNEALQKECREFPQVLCVVNTRKHARDLFRLLDDGNCFHLSTLMCPVHRRAVIAEIRKRLDDGQPCRVVSTQLIEAGVDLDFPVVYRAMAGLDSIIQAAGRCNREAKAKTGTVSVFEPEDCYTPKSHTFQRPIQVARSVMRRHEDLLSAEAVEDYFSELYRTEGELGLDVKRIVPELESGAVANRFLFNFPKTAQDFQLIESQTVPILVPYNEKAEALIKSLRKGPTRELTRSLQSYTVNVYQYEFESLFNAGLLEPAPGDTFVLLEREHYHEKTGLDVLSPSGFAITV